MSNEALEIIEKLKQVKQLDYEIAKLEESEYMEKIFSYILLKNYRDLPVNTPEEVLKIDGISSCVLYEDGLIIYSLSDRELYVKREYLINPEQILEDMNKDKERELSRKEQQRNKEYEEYLRLKSIFEAEDSIKSNYDKS